MSQTDYRIARLEEEVQTLKAQLELERRERKNDTLVKDELEKISRRQDVLIKALKIMQSANSLSQAMNEMLAEIGKFAGVSRVYVFEKNADETTISCACEWINTDITRIIDDFQNAPIEIFQPWFDVFDTGESINTPDINTLDPKIIEILSRYEVKSFLNLPLTSGDVHYGFIGFDECVSNREWDENEVELLKNLSQIISATKRRFQAETSLLQSDQTMRMVLNNINASIVVTDFETMKILFVNDALRKMVGGEMEGMNCWKILQVGQSGVCDFCPKNHLLDSNHCSTGVYRFEHYFEKFKKHMVVDAVATEWIDGRRVLLEVIFDITKRKLAEQDLLDERDRLRAIGDHLPNGALFRFEINPQNMTEMRLSYMSAKWEEVMGTDIGETMADISKWFDTILPEHTERLTEEIIRCTSTLQHFMFEYQIRHKGNKIKWLQVSSYPKKIADDKIVFDGFVLDITARKNAEIKLAKHHNELEFLVKERTEELAVAYEEMQATNEELRATTEELYRYQTQLETMVAEKTSEVIARREELEKISRSQAILIEVLKIVQSADDLSQAMHKALAEIGKYAGVSRIHAFEKSADGTTVSCFMGWCNDGIESITDRLQNIPVEMAQAFILMSETGEYVSASDSEALSPELSEMLVKTGGVKSVIVFPLSSGSVNYGFVVFDECIHDRMWNENELELLKNLSQIISTARNRHQAEQELAESESKQRFIFDNTKDVFWIADYETTKFTFVSGNCLDMFGAVGEAFIGMSFYECFLPEMRGKIETLVKQKVEEFYETGAYHFQVIQQHYNKDGVKIWMESSFQLVPDKNGKITQVVGIERDIDEKKKAEEALLIERDRIQAIGDNFPEGSLFRHEINPQNMNMRFTYLSATWEDVMGITIEETLADASKAFDIIFPEYIPPLMEAIQKGIETGQHLLVETKNRYRDDKIKWLLLSSHPKIIAEDRVVFDGFVLDITHRKENEIELAKHREELEFLVKDRTEELQVAYEEMQATNEELQATTEELQATNEEIQATNEVLHVTNEELDKYKTQLEEMVEGKTVELTARKEELESLNRRQEVFINVMQTLQLEEDVSKGMNRVLDIIGHYIRVDRVQIWENNVDGATYGCSYEWCGESVEPNIHLRQNLPMAYAQPWLDILLAEKMICASDIYTLSPGIYKMLERDGVKSILVLPLSLFGQQFGFIAFHICRFNKEWDKSEIELLMNIVQVFSNVIRRRQVETAMNLSQQTMRTVLDNINAQILVSEFDTYKALYANNNFKQDVEGDVEGMLCWQSRKMGGQCEHCRRPLLRDSDGNPTGVHRWEYFNPRTKRWFIIMGTAIKWVNGQLAVLELATDITDRKLNEIELVRAREKAEESDKLKSAFLANMSHEIRTPINGITGFLHFIASDDLTPERKKKYLSVVNNSAAQLVQLIDDIIDVSKIEAKQMTIFPVPVDLNQLMYESLMLYENNLQTRNKSNVTLIYDDSGSIDNCTILVDPTRMRQVLNNLVGNAIKYTEKGYIRFGYRQPAPDKLEFTVEDTGIGMAANQHELIFERFRQAENHFHEGTGLGLNIAKSLVQMMGGEIWLESTEGIGSIFYFTISYLPVET